MQTCNRLLYLACGVLAAALLIFLTVSPNLSNQPFLSLKTKTTSAFLRQRASKGALNSQSNARTHLKSHTQPLHILISSSVGRSGSSFIGELVTSMFGARYFYFFEPLITLKYGKLTSSAVQDSLKRLFKCDIGDHYVLNRTKPFNILRHNSLKKCQDGNQKRKLVKYKPNYVPCVSIDAVKSFCKREPIRIIKTIRSRVVWTKALLEDPELNLKIIHLVRDPRGILSSATRLNWGMNIDHVCNLLSEDLDEDEKLMKIYPNRYKIIKYEDVCVHPWERSLELYKFLLKEPTQYFTSPFITTKMQHEDTFTSHKPIGSSNMENSINSKESNASNNIKTNSKIHIEKNPENLLLDMLSSIGIGLPRGVATSQLTYQNNKMKRFMKYLPKSTIKFLQLHLHPILHKERDPWTTYRDTTNVYQLWRKDIMGGILLQVEEQCKNLIQRLNHTIFGSIENAHNFTISLFDT